MKFEQTKTLFGVAPAEGTLGLQMPKGAASVDCPYEMAGHQEVPGPETVCSFSDRFHGRSDDQRPASGLALCFPACSRCGCRRGFAIGRSDRNHYRFTPA